MKSIVFGIIIGVIIFAITIVGFSNLPEKDPERMVTQIPILDRDKLMEDNTFQSNYTAGIISDSQIKVVSESVDSNYSKTNNHTNDVQELFNSITITHSSDSGTPACVPDCFIPNTVTIDVGESVTFFNNDNTSHIIASGTVNDGLDDVFHSGELKSKHSYSVVLYEEGIYPYFSLVSPWMNGKIIVGNPDLNLPPTVFAGEDQIVDKNSRVTLSGYGIDSEEKPLQYVWTQISGPTVHLSGSALAGFPARSQSPVFIAPNATSTETLVFELTVEDSILQSTSDIVSITVVDLETLPPSQETNNPEFLISVIPEIDIDAYEKQYPNSFNRKYVESSALRISPLMNTNPQAFTSDKVIMNLFEDSFLVEKSYMRYHGDSGSNFSWVGKVLGMESVNVVLGIGDDHIVTGNIKTQTNSYMIKSVGNGYSVVIELDRSKMYRSVD